MNQNSKTNAAVVDRTWPVVCHLAALAALIMPLGNIIGPLVVWLSRKGQDPEVEVHGRASLNCQFTMMVVIAFLVILAVGAFVVGVVLLGSQESLTTQQKNSVGLEAVSTGLVFITSLVILSFVGVFNLVQVILNAVRANEGRKPKYWPLIQFFKA